MQGRVLQHPRAVYIQRIRAVVYRLEHPMLLTHIIGTLTNSLKGSNADPLDSFDELLGVMAPR
jgi:hypothetical protein